MELTKDILEFELLSVGEYAVNVSTLVVMGMILGFTKVVLWFIKKALFRAKNLSKLDAGNAYALFQIVKYLVWVIAAGFLLETVGVKVTVLIAGSAALLVGVGLGLQQTFNDIVSGIILLSERSIKVDDVLEIDGDVVRIQSIGLRTSKGLNRDDISIIIPNSLITTSKVINWSHQSEKTRFRIDVGVAYGTDVDTAIRILEESALDHPDIDDSGMVEGQLKGFGDSSIDLQLLFFSRNIFRIGRVKSDIRRIIDQKFRENEINIPFPQMDLHVKSDSRS